MLEGTSAVLGQVLFAEDENESWKLERGNYSPRVQMGDDQAMTARPRTLLPSLRTGFAPAAAGG